jgi:hypothetical protein
MMPRHDVVACGPNGEPSTVRQHIRQVENDTNLELVAIAMAIGVSPAYWENRVQSPDIFRPEGISDQVGNGGNDIGITGGQIVDPLLAAKALAKLHPSFAVLDRLRFAAVFE